MNRAICTLITIPLFLLLGACGPAVATQSAGLPYMITLTPQAPVAGSSQDSTRLALETEAVSPTQNLKTSLPASDTETSAPGPTSTTSPATPTLAPPAPTTIVYLPTATETLLPQLELPTEQPRAPALVAWTGLPTYPGDSDLGRLFRLDYDPDTWAQTEGLFGDIVLGNRQIEYCTITPWTGRGLPVDWKVTHEFRIIGSASFDVNTVTFQDVTKFVSYIGGDTHVLTGFQVTFNQHPDQCLREAEMVFGTLRSFVSSPTATPSPVTETPTP